MTGEIEKTYRAERGNLLGFIRSKVGSRDVAEDILQDVFLQAVRMVDGSFSFDNLLAWLYAVSRNKVVDWFRRRRKQEISLDSEELEALIDDIGDEDRFGQAGDFDREAVLDLVFETIHQLPEAQRFVLLEQTIREKTFQQISDETGISVNTLLARKRYAIIALRRRLARLKEILDELE